MNLGNNNHKGSKYTENGRKEYADMTIAVSLSTFSSKIGWTLMVIDRR